MARTHGRISTYNRGCICAECREVSAARSRRYRTRHRNPAKSKQMCPLCDQWFIQVGNHERVHRASA